MSAWDWVHDCKYINDLMLKLFPLYPKFIFIADDWGGGPLAHFLTDKRYYKRVLAVIFVNPIAFDGYPVSEIQAIGRAAGLPYSPNGKYDRKKIKGMTYHEAMGAFDQTLIQIYKTMVVKPNKVYNQYSLRDIKFPYIDVDYESGTTMSLRLKMHNIRVLSERTTRLSARQLLPYDPTLNPRGVNYLRATAKVLAIWGADDPMMPALQAVRFQQALRNTTCDFKYIKNAGHFVATDDPEGVADAIMGWLTSIVGHQGMNGVYMGFKGILKGDEKRMIELLKKIKRS